MFGGATFVGLLENELPGGRRFSPVPSLIALGFVAVLVYRGPRFPIWALSSLGPIGAVLIGVAIATTNGHGDGATLFAWPVLWESHFFGRRGTILIVACVGIVDAAALTQVREGTGYVHRWLDVMEAANAELSRARRRGRTLGFVSFDIDHFKSVNDEFCHDTGDKVLMRLGQIFRSRPARATWSGGLGERGSRSCSSTRTRSRPSSTRRGCARPMASTPPGYRGRR
jgi:hypothetical protein